MIKTFPISMESVYHIGQHDLPPLDGVVVFDDRGLEVAGRPPVFNVELRLAGDLDSAGVTLSETTHRFEKSQTFRFQIRIPASEQVLARKSIHGDVVLWDTDRDQELDRLPVHVAKIEFLDRRPGIVPWVLDLGGHSSVIGGQVEGGAGPCFAAYPPMPLRSELTVSARTRQLRMPDEAGGAGADGIAVAGLKDIVGKNDTGPSEAYPHTGAGLNAFFIGNLLKRALLASGGLPPTLYVTVPAAYSAQQVEDYRRVIARATEQIGLAIPRLEVLDEATAGGIGVLQEMLEELGAPAMCHVRRCGDAAGADAADADAADADAAPGAGRFTFVGIDLGAATTDLSLVSVEIDHADGRFIANTRLEAAVGLPVGGYAYTRLVMLMIVARLLKANGRDRAVAADVQLLAAGDIGGFGDPFLTGRDNTRTQRLLDALTAFLPKHQDDDDAGSRATRETLFEIAEFVKIALNTPASPEVAQAAVGQADGHVDDSAYPDEVELGAAQLDAWRELCRYHNLTAAEDAVAIDAPTLARLFEPALRQLVDVAAGLCRVQEQPVNAICLTGNASRLRALQERTSSFLLGRLSDDVFDRHPWRIFRAAEAKLAVAKGAYAVFHGAAQARDWDWRCSGLLDVLPYDLGRINAAKSFEVLVPRGTTLPHEMTPPNRPRELTLYQRAYAGAKPAVVGTLAFDQDGPDFEPRLKLDRERRIVNQDDRPITAPPPPVGGAGVPLLNDFAEAPGPSGHRW